MIYSYMYVVYGITTIKWKNIIKRSLYIYEIKIEKNEDILLIYINYIIYNGYIEKIGLVEQYIILKKYTFMYFIYIFSRPYRIYVYYYIETLYK